MALLDGLVCVLLKSSIKPILNRPNGTKKLMESTDELLNTLYNTLNLK